MSSGSFLNIHGSSRLLVFSAAIGLIAYLLILPRQHPDSIATTVLSSEDVTEIASAFLQSHGYTIEDMRVKARIIRDASLIGSVQDSLDRSGLLGEATPEVLDKLPLYYWNVSFFRKAEAVGWQPRFSVDVTLNGKVWEFENTAEVFIDKVNRDALRTMRVSLTDGERPSGSRPPPPPDSVLSRSIEFDTDEFPARVDSTVMAQAGTSLTQDALSGDRTLLVSPRGAIDLAQYYLRQLDAPAGFEPDSVWLASEGNSVRALVRYQATLPILKQAMAPIVSVTPQGSLYQISYVLANTSSDNNLGRTELVGMLITGILALVIVFFLLVTFFRRLMERLIDVKAALIDALIVSTLLVIFLVLQENLVFGFSSLPTWGRWLLPFVIGGFAGGGMAVLLFLVTSAADSLARSRWSKQLASMSLVRQGRVMNARVGSGLVNGVLTGFVLLGIVAIELALLPMANIDVGENTVQNNILLALPSAISLVGFISYVEIGILFITVATIVRRWTANRYVLVVVAAAFFGAMQIVFPALRPIGFTWVASAVLGLAIAWAFLRFDLFTCIIALFSANLIWFLQDGWLIEGSPGLPPYILGFAVVLGLLGFGILGIVKGAPVERVRDYVPEYIREVRRQERLQHELSIAQQVQESFLPRKMPQLAGIDVAARCLAAEEVGGDYYDFVVMGPDRLAVVIGDVSGKGIQAAFFMTLAKGFIRTLCKENHDPATVLTKVNELFCENAPKGMFVTMIFGILDITGKSFTFARAGHNPVIFRDGSNEVSFNQPRGLGIGLVTGERFRESIEQSVIHLDEGDSVVLFTDGFSEAMNHSRELFGDKRLSAVVRRSRSESADGLLEEVQEAVDNFVMGADRHDDMTMIVFKLVSTNGQINSHSDIT